MQNEACPECGAFRRDSERYCRTCNFDFESLSYRYRGTQWSGQDRGYGYGSARTAVASAAPARPVRTAAHWLLRVVLFYAGIAIVGGVSLWSVRSGVVPDYEFTGEGPRIAMIAMPMIAGVVSLIIPGRFARGLGKGCLLGFVAWFLVAAFLFINSGILLEQIGTLGGMLEHTLVAIVGASLFRLALLPLGVDE